MEEVGRGLKNCEDLWHPLILFFKGICIVMYFICIAVYVEIWLSVAKRCRRIIQTLL